MNENAKTKLVLEYTGMDDFSCPVYKDQFGKLWKDIDLGKEPEPNLSKLQSNCEYYLGYGNRSPSILCNHSVQNHIARMKELWNGFPTDQKPEWLT